MNGKKPDRPVSFLLLALMVSLQLTTLSPETAQTSELVILYSNDIRGEIEPCG